MRPGLKIGGVHVLRYTVPVHQTVPDLLPALAEFRRGQPVFATGFMVGLMEAPCMAAVYPYLEDGEVTVGTLINMRHSAPSPPGTALVAEARLTALEGRSVRFDVVVVDHTGEIAAAGEHALRVVQVARFHDRLAAKHGQTRRSHPSHPRGDHERSQSHLVIDPLASAGTRSHRPHVNLDHDLTTARRQRPRPAHTASGDPQ